MKLNFQKSTGDRARLACGQRRLVVGVEGSSTRGASNHSRGGCAPRFEPSIFNLQSSRSGVALIITLILLAVVTVMAITFLAVSRRERGAVSTTTDTATARLAADAALANAEAQIMANLLATTNPYNFGLVVSTNYINPVGFLNGNTSANPTNVNYDNAGANGEQNIANLLYSPRAPVFVQTNSAGSNDFRFYLDLNRNGRFDTNGEVGMFDNNNKLIGNANEVGDPEWIGGLERPDAPHGPNNPFLYRYAFIAVPIGNALDLNAIYNDATRPTVNPRNPGNDGFLRNEGVGSWEINLAAFLTDLNTNQWDPSGDIYSYQEPNFANAGAGFEDALSLLNYRYGGNYNNLASVDAMFGVSGDNAFKFDMIDGYSDGPLQTGLSLPGDSNRPQNDNPLFPWSGADNTNHFFNLQELFDPAKTSGGATGGFTNRLLNAGNGTSTYDRYTFYRLLSQMGVESAPEQNKLNLNYSNAVAYYDVNGILTNSAIIPNAETNFVQWTPTNFFTLAADRMLRAYSEEWLARDPSNYVASYNVTNAFGITNIPVLVSNRLVYSSAINRVLQLAANIYDATTNNTLALGRNFPSVFRPTFNVVRENGYTNVYMNGYEQVASVTGPSDTQLNLPVDVTALAPDFGFGTFTNVNVYGVPWIIGAKKGFPNFNEFAMESAFQLTRKLEVTRTSTNETIAPISSYQYNQMFLLSVSNQFGVECWNSYASNFNDSVAIYVTEDLTNAVLTNDENFSANISIPQINGFLQISSASNNNNGWPGYNPTVNPLMVPVSFQIPLNAAVAVITNSMYRFNGGNPFLTTNVALDYEQNVSSYPQPHWWLMTTNNLRVIILDTAVTPNRVIDYVQLSGPNSARDLTAEILKNYDTGTDPGDDLWDTNRNNQDIPIGIGNQVTVNLGLASPGTASGTWDTQDVTKRENEIDGFRAFYHISPLYNNAGAQDVIAKASSTNYAQTPYNASPVVVQHFSWQANDPLVHYIASDLNWPGANRLDRTVDSLATNENLGKLNDRYMPWGGNPRLPGADQNPYNLALKDPLTTNSDSWDFPTNKFPTVGWLGRVHRGTPWQTVYLKSPDVLNETNAFGANIGTNTWVNWTGDENIFDASNSAPVQDRLLFDLFSTAFNDNATLGQLSVNVGANDTSNPQAGLAAWSALFSGVIVPTNTTGGYTIVQPAGSVGASSFLGKLVTNINQTRLTFTNTDGLVGSFEHVGDVLAAPFLTVSNQWLLQNNSTNTINDAMYEWLPQQTLSLLRVADSPRYVIYSYGQALKPAPHGIVTSGGNFFGMITNYQVVSEIATRTVVRFNSQRINNVFQTNIFGSLIWTNVPSVTNNNAVIESYNVLPPD